MMYLQAFDHVNIRTENLAELVAWYDGVLGLKSGRRPDFDFPGAWLYLGDQAIVHLIGVSAAPKSIEPRIEHFAIRAIDKAGFLAHLTALHVPYRLGEAPGTGVTQVNICDPDGNHIHIDFRN
jgi:catechol 2,3-dioxygenase-like lactoylglutathione lyase family enzyme